jgi:metallophosphoesterase superfamily enzyme
LDYYEKFYNEVFFPALQDNGIGTVLILGDTFDRRKYINFFTLKRAKQMFFDPLAEMVSKFICLPGNHDTYFKNTNDVNSVDLLLGEYGLAINVIDQPSEIFVGPHKICMMPLDMCGEL